MPLKLVVPLVSCNSLGSYYKLSHEKCKLADISMKHLCRTSEATNGQLSSQLSCIMNDKGGECVRECIQLKRDYNMRDIILIADQENAL